MWNLYSPFEGQFSLTHLSTVHCALQVGAVHHAGPGKIQGESRLGDVLDACSPRENIFPFEMYKLASPRHATLATIGEL